MNNEKNFIIYIPGLFSSYLLKGNDIIWPIDNKDIFKIYFTNYVKNPLKKIFFKNGENTSEINQNSIISNYIEKLEDKNLEPGGLLNNNDNIINLIKKNNNNNFYIFSYDWRENFDITIDLLAKSIESLDISNKHVTLISHSAGGIIAYKYINNIEKYGKGENFKKINKFITIGCPIQGSIKALSVIMGLCHQSILTPENLKEILDKGFFKSIYQLLPANIHNIFFYKNTKTSLVVKDVINILLQNGFTEETIRKASEFREEMNNLLHNPNVEFLFIVGVYNKELMCTGFDVDPDTNHIECIYDYGAGDGSVIAYEATPTIMHRFRVRYIHGKHTYLTEYDDVLDIIGNEINPEPKQRIIVIAKPLSNNNDNIEFYLFIIINNNKCLVKDIKAEKIIFTQKTYLQDITKSINRNKKRYTFNFNTPKKYGLLKLKNIKITYFESEGEQQKINKEYFKQLYIELKTPNLNFLF